MSERIADRCPSCNGHAIFIGAGGWLTCSYIDCPEPVIGSAIRKIEAELEQIKQRLLSAVTAEVNDTGMGYTERIVTIVEELLSEWEITAAHEHILEDAYVRGALDYCRRESFVRADIGVPDNLAEEGSMSKLNEIEARLDAFSDEDEVDTLTAGDTLLLIRAVRQLGAAWLDAKKKEPQLFMHSPGFYSIDTDVLELLEEA